MTGPQIPDDVWEWVVETYKPRGRAIWLRAWHRGDDAKRERMLAAARSDGNGS